MSNFLPIIYVRGYAGNAAAVESAVDSPYYGFNDGSSKVRTGPGGKPELYLFESPLLRLMKDHEYLDYFAQVQAGKVRILKSEEKDSYPEKSLWIFRYYDETSTTVGSGYRTPIEALGKQLALLIDYVLQRTGAPKVHLVAHSMGGLVCRSAIQLTMKAQAKTKIARLFTYGTPHGGIHFRPGLGWVSNIRDLVGSNDMDNFGPKRMKEYLGFPKTHRDDCLHEIGTHFDPLNCFCLVGTNYDDYTVGASKIGVGPGSDGLVMIEHATIKGSNRAFVHRSHSGPYGLVNSEEGYQNLQRFLFGNTAVKISVTGVVVAAGAKSRADGSILEMMVLETEFGLRGEFVYLNQQLQRDGSAQPVTPENLKSGKETLFRAFLMDSKRPTNQHQYSQFQFAIRIVPIYVKDGRRSKKHDYPGQALFEGQLCVAIGSGDGNGVRKVKIGWGTMDDTLYQSKPFEIPAEGGIYELDLPLHGSWIQSGRVLFQVEGVSS